MRWAVRPQATTSRVGEVRSPVVVGPVALDLAASRVLIGGRVVHLPVREALLLDLLMRRPGRVLTSDELRAAGDAVAVRRTFRRLARRLMVDPLTPRLVERVDGSGYRFTPIPE